MRRCREQRKSRCVSRASQVRHLQSIFAPCVAFAGAAVANARRAPPRNRVRAGRHQHLGTSCRACFLALYPHSRRLPPSRVARPCDAFPAAFEMAAAELPEGGHGAERGRSRSHGEGNPTLGRGARRCISSGWQRRQPAVWRCASCRGRAWPGCRWQRNGGWRRQKARLPRCACAGLHCAAECAVEMSWGCGRGTRVCPRGCWVRCAGAFKGSATTLP